MREKNFPRAENSWKTGGAEEDRTPDLRIANATLSQLSYRPMEEDFIDKRVLAQVGQKWLLE
jgi:hypothetical protein